MIRQGLIWFLSLAITAGCKTVPETLDNRSFVPDSNLDGLYLSERNYDIAAGIAVSSLVVATVILAIYGFRDTPHALETVKGMTAGDLRDFQKLPKGQKIDILRDAAEQLKKLLDTRAKVGGNGKIKVAVVISSGGDGHKSAARLIEKVLTENLKELTGIKEDIFEVKAIEPFYFSPEGWNQAMASDDGPKLKRLQDLKPAAEWMMDFAVGRQQLKRNLLKEMPDPDILVQAVHLGTSGLGKITKSLGIQHRLFPTDYQLKHFLWGKRGTNDATGTKFRIDLALDGIPEQASLERAKSIKAKLDTHDATQKLGEIRTLLADEKTDDKWVRDIYRVLDGSGSAEEKVFKISQILKNDEDLKRLEEYVGILDENSRELKKRKILSTLTVGDRVRLPIIYLAERLRDPDPAVRQKAHEEIQNFYSNAINDAAHQDEKRIFNFDMNKDRSIFMMIGGKGSSQKKIHDYAVSIAERAKAIAKAGGKVHLFVAQANDERLDQPQSEENKKTLAALQTELEKVMRESGTTDIFRFHPLARVEDTDVAKFISRSVLISKAGGSTMAELRTLGGQALIDLALTPYIDWENYTKKLFTARGWTQPIEDPTVAFRATRGQEDSFTKALLDSFGVSFADRDRRIKNSPNNFHLDWPKAVMDDALKWLPVRIRQKYPKVKLP